MDNNQTVCFCADVTKGEVIDAIKGGSNTLESLKKDHDICKNGCCESEIVKILEENA